MLALNCKYTLLAEEKTALGTREDQGDTQNQEVGRDPDPQTGGIITEEGMPAKLCLHM